MEDRQMLSRKTHKNLRKVNEVDYIQFVEECKGYLDLTKSQLTEEELNILVSPILENIRIKTLDLSQNHFSDEYGGIISGIVKNADSIVELNLKLNDLETRGVQCIGQAIGFNKTMEVLDMSWNHIRWPGAVSICNGIKVNDCLNTLNVAYNGFGYEGSVALGEMLKHNKTLQNLDVSSNRICWRAALVMSKGLSKNRSLVRLRMAHNPLTTTGALDILQSISSIGSSVEYLDIGGIEIIKEFELLSLAIQQKRNFTCIHGDIVSCHDLLGRRDPEKVDPMSKVISYLKKNRIRPLELLRSFDKPLGWNMPSPSFTDRLQRCDTDLYPYEIRQLTNNIEQNKNTEESDGVNYRKLVNSIGDHVIYLRQKRQMEVLKEKREMLYHRRILKTDVLVDDVVHSNGSENTILPTVVAMERLDILGDSAGGGSCGGARGGGGGGGGGYGGGGGGYGGGGGDGYVGGCFGSKCLRQIQQNNGLKNKRRKKKIKTSKTQ